MPIPYSPVPPSPLGTARRSALPTAAAADGSPSPPAAPAASPDSCGASGSRSQATACSLGTGRMRASISTFCA